MVGTWGAEVLVSNMDKVLPVAYGRGIAGLMADIIITGSLLYFWRTNSGTAASEEDYECVPVLTKPCRLLTSRLFSRQKYHPPEDYERNVAHRSGELTQSRQPDDDHRTLCHEERHVLPPQRPRASQGSSLLCHVYLIVLTRRRHPPSDLLLLAVDSAQCAPIIDVSVRGKVWLDEPNEWEQHLPH